MLSFSQFLQEKLIVLGGGAPYGQIAFLAGGGGSGKGFAASNFMEFNKFKVRDVDAMKSAFLELNRIFGEIKQLPDDPNSKEVHFDHGKLAHTISVPGQRSVAMSGTQYGGIKTNPYAVLKNMDLRNPSDVFKLHDFVDYLGIKDKTLLALMNAAKANSGHLPNILFDITAKDIRSIEKVISGDGKIPGLLDIGYKPVNIHMIWILADYSVAVTRNAKRSRVVPDDIMLQTHEGAAKTMFDILRGKIPHGMDGGVYVVLNRDLKPEDFNQSKNTAVSSPVSTFKPSAGVKDFTYIRYKTAGKPMANEKEVQQQIYQWIIDNIPKTKATAHIFDAGGIKESFSYQILKGNKLLKSGDVNAATPDAAFSSLSKQFPAKPGITLNIMDKRNIKDVAIHSYSGSSSGYKFDGVTNQADLMDRLASL